MKKTQLTLIAIIATMNLVYVKIAMNLKNEKMKKITLFLTLFLVYFSSYSQTMDFVWAVQSKSSGSTVGGNDYAYSVATDNQGNVYALGMFNGKATFNTTNLTSLVNPATSNYSNDMYLVKYNSAGTFQWVKQIGGVNVEWGFSLKVDAMGNSYVTGAMGSNTKIGTTTIAGNGGYDIFLAKFSTSGGLIWAQAVGGTAIEQGKAIALDYQGGLYLTGFISGTTYSHFGTDSIISNGQRDVFVAKYDTLGNYIWVKSFGGTGDDEGTDIAVDDNGNVIVVGIMNSPEMIIGNDTLSNILGNSPKSMFIKLTNAGTPIWSKQLNAETAYERSVKVDNLNNIYTTGYDSNNSGDSIIIGNDTLYPISVGTWDGHVIKMDSNGNFNWAKRFGSGGYDFAFTLELDNNNNVFVGGSFQDTCYFGIDSVISAGGLDAFLAMYDSAGTFNWVIRGGGTGDEGIRCIAKDINNHMIVTGDFTGVPTFGTTTFLNAVSADTYIAKVGYLATGIPFNDFLIKEIPLYPNPATDYLSIKGFNNIENNSFLIYHISGKLAGTFYQTNNGLIDISNLENGVYFIKTDTIENSLIGKFIKIKK